MNITVKVPATSANLGPGFDSLGLALDLWNESTFSPADDFSVAVSGEGADKLTDHRDNLILRAAQRLADLSGKPLGPFRIQCINRVPLGSGLGSSSAATLTGLLAAKNLLGEHHDLDEVNAEKEYHEIKRVDRDLVGSKS